MRPLIESFYISRRRNITLMERIVKHLKLKIGPKIDKTGRRYGKLVAIERFIRGNIKRKNIWYKCRCDCGNVIEVNSEGLKGKKKTHCGCSNLRKVRKHDLRGQKFGMLTVTEERSDENRERKGNNVFKAFWLCKCECGNEKLALASTLMNGTTYSCGCVTRMPELKNKDRKAACIDRLYACLRSKNRRVFGGEVDISIEQFSALCQMDCFYCGCPPSSIKKDEKEGRKITDFVLFYHGLDRIDSFKLYAIDNVVPCCATCNRLKFQDSLIKFIERNINGFHNYEKRKYSEC